MKRLLLFFWVVCFLPSGVILPASGQSSSLQFEVSFSGNIHTDVITGRVYVMISTNNRREPRYQVGVRGVPVWGMNVKNLRPGEGAVIDEQVFGYPLESIRDIPAGDYYVQGFINVYTEFRRSDGHTLWMHQDHWEGQNWRRSEGNLYSKVMKIHLDPSKSGIIKLVCDHVNPPVKIPEDTKWVKRVRIKSKLLSDFWGQPMYIGATVLLPKGYDEHPDQYYPVNYQHGHFSLRVPFGFRDDNRQSNYRSRYGEDFTAFWKSDTCPRFIAVKLLYPCPYYDDSYVVNSPNVGPYDDAVNRELIPYLETHFRIIRKSYARILSGGSTGGWISLAQQIFHPDFYGGVFSSCADPVDFHYYQIVNIYKDKNAYYKEYEWMKIERPDTRRPDGNISSTMRNENLYELVIGDKSRSGGQWDIWEAAFGPVGADGYPQRVWNKRTGEIDHRVAEQWKKFDLHEYLKNNWSEIGKDLQGKLFLYTGDMDSYYLNNAMELLGDFLEHTTNPYYDGRIEYGRKKPHCFGPGSIELVQLIAAQIVFNYR